MIHGDVQNIDSEFDFLGAIDNYSQSKVISIHDMPDVGAFHDFAPAVNTNFDGSKFLGGYGITQILDIDYWSLRQRSSELFTKNLYASGIVKRLVTNEITTGLTLEATPNSDILGLTDDQLNIWSEDVENRFSIWADNENLVDWHGLETFGSLQETARMSAIISGDVLVVMRISKSTGLPIIQLIDGASVRTPFSQAVRSGHTIEEGVELNANGRHVAFWIVQDDGTSKRIAANGEKSGRRLAWLVYGTKKRINEVRGMPLLALILQSLNEIDRYRDSEQRAAVLNSILALWVKKGEDKPGTLPFSSGAVSRESVVLDNGTNETRVFDTAASIPGITMEELQTGEEPVSFDTKRPNVNFGLFEASIINAMAWGLEMPPEILTLSFSSNYAAARGAINEFKIYLDKTRSAFGAMFTKPIYKQWLISEVLLGKIQAPGLLEAWRDPKQYDILGSWLSSDWQGAVKPSADVRKDTQAYKEQIAEGLITHERAAKELNGSKFSKNVKRLKKENQILKEANDELIPDEPVQTGGFSAKFEDRIMAKLEDVVENVISEALNNQVNA